MNPSGKISLGLDVGGTEIKGLALQGSDTILKIFDVPSNARLNPEAVRQAIIDCAARFRMEGIEYANIGLGCAGSVDPVTGVVRNSPNFAAWSNVPLRGWIEEATNVPVVVHNDANCAAYAEWKLGNAVGSTNMVLLTFGTGVGGGLIINNRLFVGSTGSGGELGHFSIHSDGILCACGNIGCFERYCSASALQLKIKGHNAKQIFDQAAISPFKEAVETFVQDVKVGITSIANVFDPDKILLGGAVAQGLLPYLAEIQNWIETHAFPAVSKNTKVAMTKFGNQSGALGAALLSREK